MKRVLLVLLLLLVVAAGAALLFWPPAKAWLEAQVGVAGRGEAGLVLYGNVEIREVQLAFRQSGRLLAMSFDEGDRVEAGAAMAELEATPFRDAEAVAEAEVRQAEAELQKLKSGSRPQEIAQAEAEVRQAEATLANAAQEYERMSKLVASSTVSRSARDTARAARDEATAALAAKQEALALLQAGSRSEDIAAGEAALAAAWARLQQARTALGDTRLVAPAEGTVLARVVEPGAMVGPASPVFTLSLRNPVYVRAYVAEPDLGSVAPGTQVAVRSDSSSKTYRGQVGFVSPRAEFTPKSVETTELRTDLVYRLRIVVTDADEGLRQGMPVTVLVGAPRPQG